MGVISSKGIIGVISSVSENYSSVISVLNTDLQINAKFKKNNPKVNVERIKEKTGINNRYISGKNETVIDISIKAANKLLQKFSKSIQVPLTFYTCDFPK